MPTMRKKAVFLNFHPAFYPPRSGGELRYWNLATRLSKSFDVEMINPTFGEAEREEIQHAEHCKEIRIPKNDAYNKWHGFFSRATKFSECSALVSLLAVKKHPEYLDEVARATADADVVIHSSPFVFPAYPKPKPNQLFIYDSYNVEAKLSRESLGGGFWGKWGTHKIASAEKKLCKRADHVLVCSHEDGNLFQSEMGIEEHKFFEIPNGVNASEITPPSPSQRRVARQALGLADYRPAVFFFGSFHPPNMEAAQYILNNIAPQLPGIDFLIAGKVCEGVRNHSVPKNVHLLGLVSEETKEHLLHGVDIAINPMFSGSGTNLKMLEFMAAGLPIISTVVGARGLDLRNDEHASIIDPKYFVRAIQDLIADLSKREIYSRAVRRLATSRFDWDIIGEHLRSFIEIKTSRRVLMLNDYPISPVTAGGKIRLDALGKYLGKSGHAVTALTLSSENKFRQSIHSENFLEINVPKSGRLQTLNRVQSAQAETSLDDVTASLHPEMNQNYLALLEKEAAKADVILLNHCYMAPYTKRVAGDTPVIYESHNVESELKKRIYPDTPLAQKMAEEVVGIEKLALKISSFTTCVSELDREHFISDMGLEKSKSTVSPNGVDCSCLRPLSSNQRKAQRHQFGLGKEPIAVFLGSGHPPNAEAAEFIMDEVATKNPKLTILLIGSVCGWFHSRAIPENVVLMGEVSSQAKDVLLQHADIALNPLFVGSGSSLKVPEYLRAGLPVISTTIGARGFFTAQGNGMIVCEKEDFAVETKKLVMNEKECERLAKLARKTAEQHFDWSVSLKPLLEVIEELMPKQSCASESVAKKEQVVS